MRLAIQLDLPTSPFIKGDDIMRPWTRESILCIIKARYRYWMNYYGWEE